MRIGIDCRTILNPASGERAGVGHYTYALVRALLDQDRDNNYVLFFDHRMPHEATLEFVQSNVRIKFFPFSSYGKFLPIAYSQFLTSAALLRANLDVMHAPANIVPLGYPKRSVITIHDLAIYRHPDWFPTQILSTRLLVPQSVKRASRIIAVSKTTRDDLVDLFSVPKSRITIIPEAADTELLKLHDRHDNMRKEYRLPKRYALFVGTIEPRKNLAVLLQAWQRLQLTRPEAVNDVSLILAGGIGYRGADSITLIKKMKLSKSVRYIGYVSHNHKILLMKSASVFIFPTLYEGFGIPVLEAMQLGVPVVTTATSSIPEVAGKAAAMVDPHDVEAMAQAIRRALTDTAFAKRQVAKGLAQASNFSWRQAAEQTLTVYRQAAK